MEQLIFKGYAILIENQLVINYLKKEVTARASKKRMSDWVVTFESGGRYLIP